MIKVKNAVTLISAGQIVENLHLGLFYHDWWLTRPNTIGNWITRYAQAHRKVQAQQALAQVNGVLEALKI